ncbi:hypothetical protein DRO97_06045 [Archaeoglobales archaeon]|nr:MAG: hypothetical protein DRO97_06045 [Archaeoglobales archaeon]
MYNKMNESEKIFYKRLLEMGYKEDEIIYNPNKTPDFITTKDNKWWEVKKLYGNTIMIWDKQADVLFNRKDNTYIAVVDVSGGIVKEIIPLKKIEKGQVIYKKYNLSWVTPLEKTERRIIEWFVNEKGYKRNHIKLTTYKGINLFVTTVDNKRWLYKRIRDGSILLPTNIADLAINTDWSYYNIIIYDPKKDKVVKCLPLIELLHLDKIDNINIKWIHKRENVRVIPISENVYKELSRLKSDSNETFDNIILNLLKISRNIITNMDIRYSKIPGIKRELMPVIFAIKVAKTNDFKYLRALEKIEKNNDLSEIDEDVIDNLTKNYILIKNMSKPGEPIELASKFWYIIDTKNKKIKIYVAYNTLFCRYACDSIYGCNLFFKAIRDNELRWFGNIYEFSIDDFERSSVEELVGRCVLKCMEE